MNTCEYLVDMHTRTPCGQTARTYDVEIPLLDPTTGIVTRTARTIRVCDDHVRLYVQIFRTAYIVRERVTP